MTVIVKCRRMQTSLLPMNRSPAFWEAMCRGMSLRSQFVGDSGEMSTGCGATFAAARRQGQCGSATLQQKLTPAMVFQNCPYA